MFDSAIFEVIIGMVFIFSLLSILVTQINSVLASVLRLRARHLRDGINKLVLDPMIRAKVVTHPLIRLVQGDMTLPEQQITDEQAAKIAQGPLHYVEWINPKTFVNVLISLIRVNSDNELFGALFNIIDGMPANQDRRKLRVLVNQLVNNGEGLQELRTAVAELQEPAYREALTEAIDLIDDEIGRMGLEPNSIISLMAGLRNVKNIYLRTALETVLSTSKTLEEAEGQLALWFDEGMQRSTERFKSTMMAISIFIGICIAVIMNVDSVNIARTLWDDPALRQLVSDTARRADTTVFQQQVEEANAVTNEVIVDPSITPVPGADAQTAPTPTPTQTPLTTVQKNGQAAYKTLTSLLELRLPLGWRYLDLSTLDPADTTNAALFSDANNIWNFIPGNNQGWAGMVLAKLIGLFLTVIAIAQGAPFWFNILKRLAGGKE
jgi:hypothetical protein